MVKVLGVPAEWNVSRVSSLGLVAGYHYHDLKGLRRRLRGELRRAMLEPVTIPERETEACLVGTRLL